MSDKETWPVWLFDYDYQGETYGFEIPARTAAEAQDRVQRLAMYGRLQGELQAKIPASDNTATPVSWFVRAWCWWKNK